MLAYHRPTSPEAALRQKQEWINSAQRSQNYALVMAAGALLAIVGAIFANIPILNSSFHTSKLYLVSASGIALFTYGLNKRLNNSGYRNSTLMTTLVALALFFGCTAGFAQAAHISGDIPTLNFSIHDTLLYGLSGGAALIFLGAMIKLAVDSRKTDKFLEALGANMLVDGSNNEYALMLAKDPELMNERHTLVAFDDIFTNATLLELALFHYQASEDPAVVRKILMMDQTAGSNLTNIPNALGVTPEQMVRAINDPALTQLWASFKK